MNKIVKKILFLTFIILITSTCMFSAKIYAASCGGTLSGSGIGNKIFGGVGQAPSWWKNNNVIAVTTMTVVRAVEVLITAVCVGAVTFFAIRYFTATVAGAKKDAHGRLIRSLLMSAAAFGVTALINLLGNAILNL